MLKNPVVKHNLLCTYPAMSIVVDIANEKYLKIFQKKAICNYFYTKNMRLQIEFCNGNIINFCNDNSAIEYIDSIYLLGLFREINVYSSLKNTRFNIH